ncbi:MAG: DEAD/DEAH box helicase [Microcoleus sp.]
MQTISATWHYQLLQPLQPYAIALRDYQQKAIAGLNQLHLQGDRLGFVCAATGSGKGTIIGAIARQYVDHGKKVLIVVTMLQLIMQAVDDCRDFGLDGNLSVICGSFPKAYENLDAPVQIVTLQSVGSRDATFDYLRTADIVIFDEYHTSGFYEAATPILTDWRCNVAAFSATPYNEAYALNEKRGNIVRAHGAVICPPYRELQARGYLVPLKYSILNGVESDGRRELNTDEALRIAIAQYLQTEGVQRDGAGRSLWFCEANRSGGESQSKRLQRVAAEFGLDFAIINEEVGNDERDRLIEACSTGLIDGLVSVDAIATGVDIRPARHCNILRRIPSRDRIVQIIGRVCRISPETGKVYGYVNDWAGNVDPGDGSGLHPFIEVLSEQITEESILRGAIASEGDTPSKECSYCGAQNLIAATNCWACNTEFPRSDRASIEGSSLVPTEWEEWAQQLI